MQYRRIAYLSLPLLTLAIGAAAVAPAPAQAQTTLILPPGTIQRVQQTVIVAPSAPPAMETEVVPAPPGGQPMYWQPGHWNWTSGGWVWVGGNYAAAADRRLGAGPVGDATGRRLRLDRRALAELSRRRPTQHLRRMNMIRVLTAVALLALPLTLGACVVEGPKQPPSQVIVQPAPTLAPSSTVIVPAPAQ